MEVTPDELAGIVDLFGAIDRPTLQQACVELAYKQGVDREPESFEDAIEAAIDGYELLEIEPDDATLVVPGPAAFPELPEGVTDLPHILDVESRTVADDRLARAAQERFRADAAGAIEAGDRERIEHLLDVSYELEVWAPVELADARRRLDDALE